MESQRLFCTFRLDGDLYGVDMHDVKEVTTETTRTRIAHAPEEVLGFVNIRGHVYLVLDLRHLLGMTNAKVTNGSHLVLFKPIVGPAFGVIVDEISEVHAATSDRIEAFASSDNESVTAKIQRVELISAICKLPDELLVILNPRRFLAIVEQNFARTA